MEDKKLLNNEELEKVSGGVNFSDVPNPLSIQTKEEALKIAEQLGAGKDMGSWKTMSGEEFMQWWRSVHEKEFSVDGNLQSIDCSGLIS